MLFQVLTETFSSPVPVPPETARTVDVCAVEKALASAGFELDHWLGDHWLGDHCEGDHWLGDHCEGDHCDGDHWLGDHCEGDHWDALHCEGDHWDGDHWEGLKLAVFSVGSQFVGSQADGLYWDVLNTSAGAFAPCRFRSSSARFGPADGA